MSSGGSKVDVVIPVYNAPELTKRCIDTLYHHAFGSLGRVIVHDDASQPATARMLDELDHPGLHVHHAPQNRGFGGGVNFGMGEAQSDFVLVLNSDTSAYDDFVPPLIEALERSARLAIVSPAGNVLENYDLERCVRRDGCVVSHIFYAYAFLVRRRVFLDAGGFDPIFGRGYYEDADLSRRLSAAGWWFGVHPEATLHHEKHGSFPDAQVRALLAANSRIYYERYPEASRRVLLLSRERRLDALPEKLVEQAEEVLRGGGELRWLAPREPEELLAIQMRGASGGLLRGARLLWSKRRKTWRRFSELWLAPGAASGALAALARRLDVKVRLFP